MALFFTNRGATELANGGTSFLTSTLKIMLLNSSLTPLRTHNVISDISANELSGTGYVGGFGGGGRRTIASKTVTEVDGSNRAELSWASITWSALNAGTIGLCALVREVTSDSDSPIIAFFDAAAFPLVTNGGDVTINNPAGGAAYFSTT